MIKEIISREVLQKAATTLLLLPADEQEKMGLILYRLFRSMLCSISTAYFPTIEEEHASRSVALNLFLRNIMVVIEEKYLAASTKGGVQ